MKGSMVVEVTVVMEDMMEEVAVTQLVVIVANASSIESDRNGEQPHASTRHSSRVEMEIVVLKQHGCSFGHGAYQHH
jgi:hypothetical protein